MPSTNVCVAENLLVTKGGELQLAPWSVPRLVQDVMATSGGDGDIGATTYPPGKKLMDQRLEWKNDTPVTHTILIRCVRRYKRWIVSNPNALQFRDRWSWSVNGEPEEPSTVGTYNSQCGSAEDVGTDSVAQPNPGKFWHWWGSNTSDEWVWLPVKPGDTIKVWYQMYVWTPPPFSDNANKNKPQHVAEAGWSRIQMIAFPQQGELVRG